jgi:hypothetical protein
MINRLAGCYFFMASISYLQTVDDIIDHEGSSGILIESDSQERSLVHYASAGGRLRLFWRFLASRADHIRDHLHIDLSKSDWRGVTAVEHSAQQGDTLEFHVFHDIEMPLLAMG